MTDTVTVRSLHDEAMYHSQDAFVLARRSNLSPDEFDTMVAHYHQAWQLENQAIQVLLENVTDPERRQPTERILRRSAMSCLYAAFRAMDRWEAEQEEGG